MILQTDNHLRMPLRKGNVMKEKLFVSIILCSIFVFAGCGREEKAAGYLKEQYALETAEVPRKVILDCDMTYLGDDAMCMCILAQADNIGLIDLLGVTITGGNSFVASGTNAALNQLEAIGREDIPVYMGTDVPLHGFRNMAEQEKIVGNIAPWGCMYRLDNYIEPSEYHNLGSSFEREWGYSETDPQIQSSVAFMIEQVQKYPGEVTIISVGSATNIATACQQDNSFAANTAGIIYMGTTLNGQGSYTPYADFNCFYDAEAFDICLNSDFPSQTIIPHDAADAAMLNKAVFDLMDTKEDTLISELWLEHRYSLYQRTPTRKEHCADAIAAVVFLNPQVIQERKKLCVTINTDVTSEKYGSASTWEKDEKNSDTASAVFVLDLDTELYWNFVTDLLCQMQKNSGYTYSGFAQSNGL